MTKAQTIKELKKKVAFSCRILGFRGVTQGSFGHVSVRIPGTDRILIKSKGPDEAALQFATERDIITIDINGKVIEAAKGLDAPHETDMHLAVFKEREDVQSVIHTHPDWVVALTAAEKPLLPIFAAYNPPCMKLCVDGIPIYPRTITITDEELGKDFMKVMGEKNACLLQGHGMTTAGSSVEESTAISLNVFELARLNYMAYAIGTPKPVPDQDIAEYQERWVRSGRRMVRPGTTGEPSYWRYYKKLLAQSSKP